MATRAEEILASVLADIAPAALEQWQMAQGDPAERRVSVNGVRVPVVRVGWNQVDDYFDRLFDVANASVFDGRLPCCRRRWNNRFRRLAGRIDCAGRSIELSAPHYEACGSVAMGIVYLHELIHLELFALNRPFGHTPTFKARSNGLGMPDVHHNLPLPARMTAVKRHLYRCVCGIVVESRVRFRAPRACATCCRRFNRGRYDARFRLVYVGEKIGA